MEIRSVSSGQCSEYDLPLPRETNLGAVADDHWIYRALGGDKHKGTTTIDERELKDFLELEGSTFAILRVKVRNEEKDLYAYLGPELITEIWVGPSS
jgi:hypothetical protein